MEQQEIAAKEGADKSSEVCEVQETQSKNPRTMEQAASGNDDIPNVNKQVKDTEKPSFSTTEESIAPTAIQITDVICLTHEKDETADKLDKVQSAYCNEEETLQHTKTVLISSASVKEKAVDVNIKPGQTNLKSEQNNVTLSSYFIDPAPQGRHLIDSDDSSDSDSDGDDTPQILENALPQVALQNLLPQTGLGVIASQYDSDSESNDGNTSDSVEIVNAEVSIHDHRDSKVIISSDSESDIEIVSQISGTPKVIEVEDDDDENNGKPRGPVRAKGEMLLDDLPPIQDLHITVPEAECIELGKIHSIVEQLVLVDCIPGTAALDLDTVLFLEKGTKTLGQVFDVIGQVSNPLYCVRFNSSKQIKEKGIEVGQTVYVAPRTEHTRFIILSSLMSIRGSDASWEDDVEPPEKHLDYSDDEEERTARRSGKNRKQTGEDSDAAKKQRPAVGPQQKSQSKNPRPRYRRPQQYDTPPPSYSPNQMSASPSFQYNTTNTAWHANFSSPPSVYPNPYAMFSSPGNNRPQYTSQSYSQPHFNSPNSNRSPYIIPNRESPHGSPFAPPHAQFGSNYSQPQFTPPGQSNSHFIRPNPSNAQFGPPSPQFPTPPNFMYPSLFPPPPPPRQ